MLSVFSEMWTFLKDKYFSVDFVGYNYEHIRLGGNSFFSISAIIVALFLGVIVACAASLYQRRTLGDLVRALDREGAHAPETAKTLGELGLLKNTAIKGALRRGNVYGRMVVRVEPEEAEGKSAAAPDFSTDRFYLPEDKAFGALTHFDKKGTNPLVFAGVVILCIVLMSVCCRAVPELLQFADNFIGSMKGV